MTLAKDEKLGLAIAAVVGVAALATFAYRQTWSRGPAAPAPAARPEAVDDQEARDEFARQLMDAFSMSNSPATTSADGATLRIKWDMCSKQMLQRLLHDDQNLQVKSIRDLSGISTKRLKSHGFKSVVCDDGRKGLEPAVVKL